MTTDLEGVRTGEVRYMPWGEDRYSYGTTPTTMRYTGQRSEASIGLNFYGARWYDPALGRFTSPDSIIPAQQGVMGNDRFAYVNNNPIGFKDPSGHVRVCSGDGGYDPSCAGGGEKHNNQSTIPTSTTPSLEDATTDHESRRDRNIHDRTCQVPNRCGTVYDYHYTEGEVLGWTFNKIYDSFEVYLAYLSHINPSYAWKHLKGITTITPVGERG